MKIGIIDLCKQLEDPRMNRKKVHKMETIIYISIAAVISSIQTWIILIKLQTLRRKILKFCMTFIL